MGSWTRALRKQEGDNLAVHVDGFYGGSPSSSLAAMKTAEGFRRVVLFAGGSGVTSFTALLQVTARFAARFDGGGGGLVDRKASQGSRCLLYMVYIHGERGLFRLCCATNQSVLRLNYLRR